MSERLAENPSLAALVSAMRLASFCQESQTLPCFALFREKKGFRKMDRQMSASEAPEVIPRCQTRTRIAQFQKEQFSLSSFTFPKGRLLVRDWHLQSLLSACHFGKEEISHGGLLPYGISILLSLAIANLPPCISVH